MQILTYPQKSDFKHLFFKVTSQASKTLFKILTIAVQHFQKLQDQCPNNDAWKYQPVWTAIKFALTVFPQILKYYLSPNKYLHANDFKEWNKLGSVAFFMACVGVWGITDANKYQSYDQFISTFTPCTYYGLHA